MLRDHRQSQHAVRLDRGRAGAAAVGQGADVVVVVDVLSFSATVSVAVGAGIEVVPCRWGDERAGTAPRRVVLPSPNGSTITADVAATGAVCLAGCVRDAGALAGWVSARRPALRSVAVVAAGERWPDGTLRPVVEDGWGAGAVVDALARAGWPDLSREAALLESASGRELVRRGFGDDVAIAAETGAATSVAVLGPHDRAA